MCFCVFDFFYFRSMRCVFILSVQAHVLESCKCFVCVFLLVKLECLAAQSVLVLCCRLNKKKNTSCKEKISGILRFFFFRFWKKTNTIHNIIPFCLFFCVRKFVQKLKRKKYTKEGRRNAKKKLT